MFLKIKKDDSSSEITCFNFVLFKKTLIRDEKKIKIFNGLISFYCHTNFEKYLKIFNIPIYHFITYNQQEITTKKTYIFKLVNIKEKYRNQIFEQVLNNIDVNKYKNIVFIRSAIGETYMFQFFLDEYMKKHNFSYENTCFVGWREIFRDLFKMYNPKACYIHLPLDVKKCFYALLDKHYKYRNIDFHIFVDKNFIYSLMEDFKNGHDSHYYDELLKYYNISHHDTVNKEAIYTEADICSYNQKIKYLNLKLKKFVILAPEALSIEPIKKDFWLEIEQKLISKGYDTYWNINDETIFSGKKFAKLTLTEIKYLADKAKGIIGLSSGFIETLSRCNCKQSIIYTPLKMNGICAENMMKVYSKKYFPYVNKENIFEFVYRQNEEKDLIDKILEVY